MKQIILILTTLFICSCSQPKVDPQPLSLVPESFKVLAKINIPETLAIKGLGNRLLYERNRKPSLQILPISELETLYLAAGSAQDTSNKSSLYIAQGKEKIDTEALIRDYKAAFANNPEVIIGKKKFDDYFIHTVRDKKQEVAICQVGPKTCIAGPLKLVLSSLQCGPNNISKNETLQQYMNEAKDDATSVFILSSKDGGSMLMGIDLFDSLIVNIKSAKERTLLNISAHCTDNETAQKTNNALILLRTFLLYKNAKYMTSEDIQVSHEDNRATAKASFSNEAMKELFEKK